MTIAAPNIKQGQIWWADLPGAEGSESSRQPILVAQSDPFNQSALQTVVCIALSDNWRLAEAPGNILLSQSDTGLPKVVVANVSHLITLEKRFLTEYVNIVPSWVLECILDGIQLVFGR
jgi:mRNA interferase MazF